MVVRSLFLTRPGGGTMIDNTSNPLSSRRRVSQKVKGLEPQRHKGTKEDFFCLPSVAQTSTEKTLCLRVFVVPFFSGSFATTSKEGVHLAVDSLFRRNDTNSQGVKPFNTTEVGNEDWG